MIVRPRLRIGQVWRLARARSTSTASRNVRRLTGAHASQVLFAQRRGGGADRRGNWRAERLEERDLPDRPDPRAGGRPELGPDRPSDGAPPATDDAGSPVLKEGEDVLVELRGIGAGMFLTTDRLIVARDGVERRPRSGVQSFPLAAEPRIRLEIGSPPSGRIAVATGAGQEAVSMFFDARSLKRAQELIDVARPLIARHRRLRLAGSALPRSGRPGAGAVDPV